MEPKGIDEQRDTPSEEDVESQFEMDILGGVRPDFSGANGG